MTKSKISKDFARFAKKTTKGTYDEARKAERTARGIPFDVGTKGTGVVSAIICDTAGEDDDKYPYVAAQITVSTPEGGKGKVLQGSGLRWNIRDSKRTGSDWTAEDAWGAALGMLEDLGLPEEISKGYEDFQECVDWFEKEPREVSWEVEDNSYTDRNGKQVSGKQIRAFAKVDESSIPSADADAPFNDDSEFSAYCVYRGVRHGIKSEEDDMLTIVNLQNKMEREVSRDRVEMEE
jgi:hypothetical protein